MPAKVNKKRLQKLAEIIKESSLRSTVEFGFVDDDSDRPYTKSIRVLDYNSRIPCRLYITTEENLQDSGVDIKKEFKHFRGENLYFIGLLDCEHGVYIFMNDGRLYNIHPTAGLLYREDEEAVKNRLLPGLSVYQSIKEKRRIYYELLYQNKKRLNTKEGEI